ncbi:hypothetical protein D3C80_1288290 [compost metagenome]
MPAPACPPRRRRCARKWTPCCATGKTCARTATRFLPVSRPCCRCTRSPRPWLKPCRSCRWSTRRSSRFCCRAAPRPVRSPWPSVSRCWPNVFSARSTPYWPGMRPPCRPRMPSAATPAVLARCSKPCLAVTRRSRLPACRTRTPARGWPRSPSCFSSSPAPWTKSSKPRLNCSVCAKPPGASSACRKPCSMKPRAWPPVSRTWPAGAPWILSAATCWACWRWLRSS